MSEPLLLAGVCVSALAGTGLGFLAGLVPGLHMNNIAALVSSYGSVFIALFGGLSSLLGPFSSGIAVSCFLSAAMVAHILAESVTSTYVGIPSGDVVSVLPAHRLAKAGLGRSAVRASADGALAGVILATVTLFPMCLAMGEPLKAYQVLRGAMGAIVVFFSCVLVFSEGSRTPGIRHLRQRLRVILKGSLIFASAGLLGLIVLKTGLYCCNLPDLPWMPHGFVPRDSLLLPMFAGLFGIPSLILSLGSATPPDIHAHGNCVHIHRPSAKDAVVSWLGGTIVGWMPGMTSGAAATLCSPATRDAMGDEDVPASLRFIWLYSSISSSGAVFAMGALFTIMKARSGTMDSVSMFLGLGSGPASWQSSLPVMISLATAMVLAGVVSHSMLRLMDKKMREVRSIMSSKAVALATLAFIFSLCVALTGIRGSLVLFSSVVLGLLAPLAGVRRIQLMGCLLIPIALTILVVA